MYKVDRIVPRIYDFIHTDDMYQVDKYIGQVYTNNLTEGLINNHKMEEFHKLNKTLLYILNYFETFHNSDKSSKTKFALTELNKNTSPKLNSNLTTIAVLANPNNPPLGVILFYQLLIENGYNVFVKSFKQCDVQILPNSLQTVLDNLKTPLSNNKCSDYPNLHIVWSTTPMDCMFFVNVDSPFLYGECILVQFILNACSTFKAFDILYKLEFGINLGDQTLQLQTLKDLNKNPYFVDKVYDFPSIFDSFLFTSLKKANLVKSLPDNLKKWYSFCCKFKTFSLL